MRLHLGGLFVIASELSHVLASDPPGYRSNARPCDAILSRDVDILHGTCQTYSACEPYIRLKPYVSRPRYPGCGKVLSLAVQSARLKKPLIAKGETCCIKLACDISDWIVKQPGFRSQFQGIHWCTNVERFVNNYAISEGGPEEVFEGRRHVSSLFTGEASKFPFIIAYNRLFDVMPPTNDY